MWFTSDTHFNHEKIILLSHRPYQSVEEMNEALIANWNDRVEKRDIVWHLGDFVFRGDPAPLFHRLNGQKRFVLGNHDKPNQLRALAGADNVHDVKYVREAGYRFFLSHYAHRTWPNSNHGSFHLYGHSHGDLPGHGRSMDVGVDANGYSPIHIDEVVARLGALELTNHHLERSYE